MLVVIFFPSFNNLISIIFSQGLRNCTDVLLNDTWTFTWEDFWVLELLEHCTRCVLTADQ